jgi:hypothetical protein
MLNIMPSRIHTVRHYWFKNLDAIADRLRSESDMNPSNVKDILKKVTSSRLWHVPPALETAILALVNGNLFDTDFGSKQDIEFFYSCPQHICAIGP